ncbi:MAG TPA: NAD(+) synthase [Bacillota bacterium]|jgi:NAD+ synthase
MTDVAGRVDRLVRWIRDQVTAAGGKGCAFGLSGGIDSAVVAGLCRRAFPDGCLGLIMPCHSQPVDQEDALLVASALGVPIKTVDLSPIYDRFIEVLGMAEGPPPPGGSSEALALANIKPRLRMMTVYYHANLRGYLVIGTGNRSELAMGYFTKYGDGGVDLLPLGNLVKAEVREVARELGVPVRVVDKPPTAGLWPGQTDEGEMGLTYAQLDEFLLTGNGPADVVAKIRSRMTGSEHKRRLPPIAMV